MRGRCYRPLLRYCRDVFRKLSMPLRNSLVLSILLSSIRQSVQRLFVCVHPAKLRNKLKCSLALQFIDLFLAAAISTHGASDRYCACAVECISYCWPIWLIDKNKCRNIDIYILFEFQVGHKNIFKNHCARLQPSRWRSNSWKSRI